MRSIQRTTYHVALGFVLVSGVFACAPCCSPSAKGAAAPKAQTRADVAQVAPRVVYETPPPGTVTEKWHEPMNDVVEVPAQLDPTGTYYLPKHEEVVEIRKDRYRETDYGEGNQRLSAPKAPVQPVEEVK